MSRKRRIEIVRAEIVPLTPAESKAETENNFKLMVKQMVDEGVSEAMSGKGSDFEPFFSSKEISYEIRRRQSVHEQNKWTYYFEDWGCMVCGTRKDGHYSCGMCKTCNNRVKQRLKASLRKRKPPKDIAQPTFMDSVRMARASLAPSLETSSTETTPRRRPK